MKNPTILVDVDVHGQVTVYWHDPEMSGRISPKIYVRDTENGVYVPKGIETDEVRDFDDLCEDQWTQEIF